MTARALLGDGSCSAWRWLFFFFAHFFSLGAELHTADDADTCAAVTAAHALEPRAVIEAAESSTSASHRAATHAATVDVRSGADATVTFLALCGSSKISPSDGSVLQ